MKNKTDLKLLEKKILEFKSNQIKNTHTEKEAMKHILNQIYNYIESLNIDTENSSVRSEYQKMLHAVNWIYKYLYDRSNSNLKLEDVKIFSSYVLEKITWLWSIIDHLDKKI